MKAQIRNVQDHDISYEALAFVCPGCILMHGGTGLHLLPVNSNVKSPSWTWDGNLDSPTLDPSIMTGRNSDKICHSYLRNGEFQFLSDCTHELAGTFADMVDLPEWFTRETEERG